MMKLSRGQWTPLSIALGAALFTAAGCSDDSLSGDDLGTSEEAVLSQCTISISALPTTVTLGQPVTFTANASCPSGTPEIQWYQKINSAWQIVQTYNTSMTLNFDTSASPVGVNSFYAGVRKQGASPPESPVNSNTVNVTINDNVPSCTKVVMTAPVNNSTGVAGTPINLAANPTCPGPSECQFWYKLSTASNWTVMPAYSQACTGTFTPPSAGTWNLSAAARVQGAHVQYSARSMTVSVVISAQQVDHPPVAVDDTGSTNQHTADTITVVANDSDPDNDPIGVSAVTQGSNGAVTFTPGGGTVTYTPAGHFVGNDAFTYTISDGRGGFATANVTMTVLDQSPVANADSASTTVHAGVTLDPTTNDTDPDGDPLTVIGVGTAANGVVTQNGNNLTYTPNLPFPGPSDSFTYTISDGAGGMATSTVTVTVTDQAPIAGDDSLSVSANGSGQVDIGTNDSDPDSDPLVWAVATGPSNGQVSFSGSVATYTPNANYVGSDSFTYTATDPYGASATATVSVTVTDLAPSANDDSITTQANQQGSVNVLTNDSSPVGASLTVTAVGTASHGTPAIGSGGVVTYTPNNAYVGSDSFTYTITDQYGDTAGATVNVTVTDVPPVANNDTLTTPMNTQGSVNVLANDSSPIGAPLTVTGVGPASHGTPSVGSGGNVNYTPNAGYIGADSFTYQISDGSGGTASATVNVTVTSTTVGCTISITTTTPTAVWGGNAHFDATATCNTGPADVQWYHRINSGWEVIGAYGAAQSLDYTPSVVGDNQFYAAARTHGTTMPIATSNTVHVTVNDNVAPCTRVVMTSPAPNFVGTVGTPITLSGSGTCPTGETPQYTYWVKLSTAGSFTQLPGNFSGSTTWSPPSAGTWNLKVGVAPSTGHVVYNVMSSQVNGTVN